MLTYQSYCSIVEMVAEAHFHPSLCSKSQKHFHGAYRLHMTAHRRLRERKESCHKWNNTKQISQPLRGFCSRSPSLSTSLAKRTGNISIFLNKIHPSFLFKLISMKGITYKKMRLYCMTCLSPKEKEIIRSKWKFTLLFILKRTREKKAAI